MSILLKVVKELHTPIEEIPKIIKEIQKIEMVNGKDYDITVNKERLKFTLFWKPTVEIPH